MEYFINNVTEKQLKAYFHIFKNIHSRKSKKKSNFINLFKLNTFFKLNKLN